MTTYRLTYGASDGPAITQTLMDVELEREDGWLVIFRGTRAFLRLPEELIQAVEEVSEPAQARELQTALMNSRLTPSGTIVLGQARARVEATRARVNEASAAASSPAHGNRRVRRGRSAAPLSAPVPS